MRQIVYFSTACRSQHIVVDNVLATSRRRNAAEGVTGLLIAGVGRYLQVIEGPSASVDALYGRLRRDDRHSSMSLLVNRAIRGRSFADWSMAYQAEPRLGALGTFRDLVALMRDAVADPRLRDQIDCFERRFATTPVDDANVPWTLARR